MRPSALLSAEKAGAAATVDTSGTGHSAPSNVPKECDPMATQEGYCVKCREKRQFEGQEVELANGRRAAQGPCPVCGTKINRMLGAKK
jgi:ligand-binding sensor protein